MLQSKIATILTTENMRTLEETIKSHLITDGVFSDETENFVTPAEPSATEPVKITLRTMLNNPEKVFLHTQTTTVLLKKEKDCDNFSFYSHTFKTLPEAISYYFSLEKNGEVFYYNKQGVVSTIDTAFNFKVVPNFKIPNWAKGAVMYQIFIDRFCNGDTSNDVMNREYLYLHNMAKAVPNWDEPVAPNDFFTFYGGDLQGIMDKMAYLKDLGVEVIYLTPVFVSPSNHKYDIQDYDNIDPHIGVIVNDYGKELSPYSTDNTSASMYINRTTNKKNLDASNKLMADMIDLAHKNGIKVILDGVFNHCGAFHSWLNKEKIYKKDGAYQSEKSPFKDYFLFHSDDWPDNISYDGWWGHSNHPKLNYEGSKELYDYILGIGKKWVSAPYNADGWRLDVGADLGQSQEFNHKFWRDFRTAVKEANPNAIILGEHYGDCEPWLQGDQWDTIMNYDAFMEPLTWFLTGVSKHSEEFKDFMLNNPWHFESAMKYNQAKMSIGPLQTAMNQLSNHDHSRFLTRTNMQTGRLHTAGREAADSGINKGIMFAAVVFMMTWQGAPTIYYGDEAGLTGWTDPDNRRTFPWGREDHVLISLHKMAIGLRKKYSCLKTGSVEYLANDYGILTYCRWDENSRLVVLLNNNDYSKVLKVPTWKLKDMKEMKTILTTVGDTFHTHTEKYAIVDGFMEIYMPPFSSKVLEEDMVPISCGTLY